MANILEIKFLQQPIAWQTFKFRISVDGVLAINFSGYTPFNFGLVGATLQQTVINVAADIQAGINFGGFSASYVGTSVFIEYSGEGYIAVYDVVPVLDYMHLYCVDSEAPGFDAFDVDLFSVEVIDTYDNSRTLVEHFSQADSLLLTWDGGDALYQPMMASRLEFSMQVPAAVDGYFLHLLTGDERRYLVRLKNTDVNGVVRLLWQGYILPDLYSEPYKNGALFVNFTAVDMLASLKGKYFKPWFYHTRFTVPRLLGYILAETGLQQDIFVKIAFENARDLYDNFYFWRLTNIDLENFVRGNEYDSLYTILNDVLQSLGLQILSYRGKWILQGFTRRQEASGIAEVYYPDGIYKGDVALAHDVVTPMFNTVPLVNGETPLKTVDLSFSAPAASNFFSDNVVVVSDYFSAAVVDEEFVLPGFVDVLLAGWNIVGNPPVRIMPQLPYFNYKSLTDVIPNNGYNLSESAMMVNYLECPENPFLIQGLRYELEFEVYGTARITNTTDIVNKFENGDFNFLCLYSMFHDGVEIMSNRPGFLNNQKFKTYNTYGPVDAALPGANVGGFWRLKKHFTVQGPGSVTFRFYPPLGTLMSPEVENFSIEPRVLKINLLTNFQGSENARDAQVENVKAVRNINYTTLEKVALPITNTVYGFVKNSFGYGGLRTNQYETVELGSLENFVVGQEISTGDILGLALAAYRISNVMSDYLFIRGGRKRAFIENADGSAVYFNSLYSYFGYNRALLSFLTAYDGFPRIPVDYRTYPPILPGQTVKVMSNNYAPEPVYMREFWKIYGFDDSTLQTYSKTMAYAYHCVRPGDTFSLDATALSLVWPLQRVLFRYLDQNRYFLPVRYRLNLFKGKTEVTMKEAVLTQLNDVTYE